MKKAKRQSRFTVLSWTWILIYILAIVLASVLVHSGILKISTQISLMTIGINIILALSLNLIIGVAGQFSLGHAGFMALGAYATGIITKSVDGWLGFLLSILVGVVLAIVFSIIVSYPTVRLKGDYLAIATLGFSEIIRTIILNVPITNGAAGLSAIPRFTTLPILVGVIGLVLFVCMRIIDSRFGRALSAIRDDEIATQSLGINIAYYRVLAFTNGGVMASLAGSLYAGYFGFIRPELFDFNKSIDVLVIVVLGGLGSFTGSIVAAITLGVINIVFQDFVEIRMILYALTLIVMMIFKPGGLLGNYEFSLKGIFERKGSHDHEAA